MGVSYEHLPEPHYTNHFPKKTLVLGVPVMAQWLTNPTRNDEVAGLIPGLTQWVEDPAFP